MPGQCGTVSFASTLFRHHNRPSTSVVFFIYFRFGIRYVIVAPFRSRFFAVALCGPWSTACPLLIRRSAGPLTEHARTGLIIKQLA